MTWLSLLRLPVLAAAGGSLGLHVAVVLERPVSLPWVKALAYGAAAVVVLACLRPVWHAVAHRERALPDPFFQGCPAWMTGLLLSGIFYVMADRYLYGRQVELESGVQILGPMKSAVVLRRGTVMTALLYGLAFCLLHAAANKPAGDAEQRSG